MKIELDLERNCYILSNKKSNKQLAFNNNRLFTDSISFIELHWLTTRLYFSERSILFEKLNTLGSKHIYIADKVTVYSRKNRDNILFTISYLEPTYYRTSYRHFIRIDDIRVTKRETRVQILVHELRFNAWKKAIRNFVNWYREKRRKILLTETTKYLIPELCTMVEKYV